MLHLRYEVDGPDGRITCYVYLVGDNKYDRHYHMTFEAPSDEWDKAEKVAEVMINRLAYYYRHAAFQQDLAER